MTPSGRAARRVDEPAAHLAGQELSGGRRICAFFRNRAQAEEALVPFMREGLAAGERVVRVVASGRRESDLTTLQAAGVDTRAALASGALQVEVWEDTYLRGGRFDPGAMLALLLGILAKGRMDGFSRARFVADMEWALQGTTPIQEVVEYEARADRALRKLPDFAICSYRSRSLESPVFVDILGAHPLALVGGALRATRGEDMRASARERILQATDRLFHAQGINSTSVDTVIAEADVAKATLYRHFPTKGDLIVGWLEDARPRWFDRIRSVAEARAGADKRAIPALLFEAVAEWLTADDFRGCPYLNAAVEIVDPDHPARPVIEEFLADIVVQLRSILAEAGFVDPEGLAAQVQTLLAGSISLAVARRTTEPVATARAAALRLLAQS